MYAFLCLGSGIAITAYLRRSDPKLLARRLRGPAAEKTTSQRLIQLAAAVTGASTLVVSLLDRRRSWSQVPFVLVVAGDALVLAGFAVIFSAFRENTFASAAIEVEPGQHVIATGPYAIVRHPYYAGLLLWIFATPLALGSWWGLLAAAPMLLVIAWRIRYEERFLRDHLNGYAAYCERVRYRVLPPIW